MFKHLLGLSVLLVAITVCTEWRDMAHAVNAPTAATSTLTRYTPAPLVPAHPKKITLSGGAEAHVLLGVGVCFRLTCTTACAYDQLQTNPDGGSLIGTVATVDSNQLGTTGYDDRCLTGKNDTLSVFSTGAGSAYAGVTGP